MLSVNGSPSERPGWAQDQPTSLSSHADSRMTVLDVEKSVVVMLMVGVCLLSERAAVTATWMGGR